MRRQALWSLPKRFHATAGKDSPVSWLISPGASIELLPMVTTISRQIATWQGIVTFPAPATNPEMQSKMALYLLLWSPVKRAQEEAKRVSSTLQKREKDRKMTFSLSTYTRHSSMPFFKFSLPQCQANTIYIFSWCRVQLFKRDGVILWKGHRLATQKPEAGALAILPCPWTNHLRTQASGFHLFCEIKQYLPAAPQAHRVNPRR